MGLRPQVPRWPAAALEDGVEKLTAACSAYAMRVAATPGQISFLSPVLPWFETKHINTFRQLDCMNLGVLCVYLPLPHAIASPQFLWEKV